ncbi:MAG: 4Fe-4S dicluster domain-containing protein [Halobacteriales archaeon]
MSAEPDTPDVENASIEDRLYTINYTDAGESHLGVTEPEVCESCETYECVTVCPADVWRDEGDVPTIAYENCLECGSCRFACPHDNVVWEYPDNGAGVKYKFG